MVRLPGGKEYGMQRPAQATCVIIGASVHGLSTAFHLAAKARAEGVRISAGVRVTRLHLEDMAR
jgi:hypothetical protein